ncbi:MAG TPA: GntR family transcriptional regulator, partial [Burkholderiaceae bacterium]|nr:GntR family transcriptional regulator [Burkholderiaceae bacterium]
EKNRGVFVRNIPIDEAIEIFELRATMEELVGRRLAASMAPEQQQEIEALVHAMEESVKNRDSHSYHLLNLQFHDRLVEMAGNRKLAMIYRKLVKEIALFRRLNLAGQNVLPESAHAHWAILEAIKSGNPEVAGRAMFEHAMGSRNRTIENDELRRRADTTPTES